MCIYIYVWRGSTTELFNFYSRGFNSLYIHEISERNSHPSSGKWSILIPEKYMKISLVKQLIPLVSLRSLVLKTNDRWEYADNTLESSSYSFHKLQICPLSEHMQQEDVQGLLCYFWFWHQISCFFKSLVADHILKFNFIFLFPKWEAPVAHMLGRDLKAIVQHLANLGSNSNGLEEAFSFQLWDCLYGCICQQSSEFPTEKKQKVVKSLSELPF